MEKYLARRVLNYVRDGGYDVPAELIAEALTATGDLPNHEGVEDGKQKEHNPLVSWVYQTREEWGLPEKGQS